MRAAAGGGPGRGHSVPGLCADSCSALTLGGSRPPLAKASDPTAGLPADVSELENRSAVLRQSSKSPVRLGWVVAFLLGIAAGVGGVFAWQAAVRNAETTEIAKVAPIDNSLPVGLQPPLATIPVAPLPHEPRLPEPVPEPRPEPKPIAKVVPKQPPARARVENVDQPDSTYTVPPLKNREHLVLRGQVRVLRVSGLEDGAILDATGLQAGLITVSGAIDGGSVLKLNAPDSVVAFAAVVGGKSRVEINAPGGNVWFDVPSDLGRPRSLIDGGSTVTILARTAHLRGDVDGADTKVTVTLTHNGRLKVDAVRGMAAVEYKIADAKSHAAAGFVAPTATFKKIE